jgi:hypothetical protein
MKGWIASAALAAAVLVAAEPAFAAPSGAQQPRGLRKQQDLGPDRLQGDSQVCKPVAFTGTRISRYKVCKSRTEWDQQLRSQREALEKDMQSLINPFGSVR